MKKKEIKNIDPKLEFLTALDNICKEKDIDKAIVIDAMELALSSAYKKHYGKPNGKAKVDPKTGEIKVYSYISVVEEVMDPEIEISLEDAKKINPDYELGDTIDTEVTPHDFGRVAATTAKQVVMQKVKEASRESTYNYFSDRQDEMLVGIVKFEDERNYFVDLGKSNGILPKQNLIGEEKLELEKPVKVYVQKVENSTKGLTIILSRSHYGFVKRLFESEIPEFADGTIMMHSVAREPGVRSKVAVYSTKSTFDPIGACIGEKGSRIASIMKELGNEKIDLIKYDEDPKIFIENALSPAKNLTVLITDPKENKAIVIADSDNYALAIGKKAINLKLASRLTRYYIEIKSREEAEEMGISLR